MTATNPFHPYELVSDGDDKHYLFLNGEWIANITRNEHTRKWMVRLAGGFRFEVVGDLNTAVEQVIEELEG